MTDRELMQQALEALEIESKGYNDKVVRNRGIITALRERLAQPEQEPVAYDKKELNAFVQNLYDEKMREGKHGHYETMFHVVHQAIKRVTTPPRREWVGLTDEEYSQLHDGLYQQGKLLGWVVDQVEAKLKEKNA